MYWCSIGILYAKANQVNDAFECFIRASQMSQAKTEVWFNMGRLYEQCNQQNEAKLAYKRAVFIQPDYQPAKTRLKELNMNKKIDNPPEFEHPSFEIGD
mmetsp:Transcript_37367/g.6695  ORF Transcript_37367/g.6695 Transcript_37367/m.6695 type:complete len:99 (+) Transcript_37367:523-819(+)